jgi:hypothetical protein
VLVRILGLFIVAATLWTGLSTAQEERGSTADRHKKRDLACDACHGAAQPKEPALPQACLPCHKSIEAVAEKTKELKPNPHQNHITEQSDLECTQCHHGHKADTPLCHQCHEGMKFEKKQVETK